MSTLRKADAALAALSGLLILAMISLHNGAATLQRELSAASTQCEQRLARVRGDYQAEIEDLKQYLQDRDLFLSGVSPAERRASRDSQGDSDAVQAQKVDSKYRYMYDVMDQRETVREMLRQLLLEREQYIANGNFSGEQMAALEAQIGELLGAGGYQEYQLLKDSDSEQQRLEEFAESVNEFAPLNAELRRSLLFTRLKYKQAFHTALNSAALYQQYMTAEAQDYARIVIRKAVQEYQNNYLNEVRPLLSSEQYSKLSSQANTEFSLEAQRLMKLVDSKAEPPQY